MASPAPKGVAAYPRSLLVTVGLIDGTERHGRAAPLGEGVEDLFVELGDGSVATIPAETVAYVVRHRTLAECPSEAPEGARAYKIHVTPTLHFSVWVRAASPRSPVVGIPRTADGSMQDVVVFPRGVLAMERDEPIGAMLVRSGAVNPEAVEHAVSAQRRDCGSGEHRRVGLGPRPGSSDDVVPEIQAGPASEIPGRAVDRRIGDILVARGLASPEGVERAMSERRRRPSRRLGQLLLELGIVSEKALAQTLAEKFELDWVDLTSAPPDPSLAESLPAELLEQHALVPYAMDEGDLVVAITDPLDLVGMDRLRQAYPGTLRKVLATPRALGQWLGSRSSGSDGDGPSRDELGELDRIVLRLAGSAEPARPEARGGRQSGILRGLIATARQKGATALHLQPAGGDGYRPRFRIAGRFHLSSSMSPSDAKAVSRLQVASELEQWELRGDKAKTTMVDGLPVQVAPLDAGGFVFRFAEEGESRRTLADLGMSAVMLEQVELDLCRESGLMLIVGPLGSGKSTTLEAIVRSVSARGRLAWKIHQEHLDGAGAQGLFRAFERARAAGADAIAVDVDDDLGAIPVCADAALSGHLVIATLRGSDSISALLRLRQVASPPAVWGGALSGVLAHRLLAALCPSCRVEASDQTRTLVNLADQYGKDAIRQDYPELVSCRLWRGLGCDDCGQLGTRGSVTVYEYVRRSETLVDALSRAEPGRALRLELARQGTSTLIQAAISKVLSGAVDVRSLVP